MNVWKPHYSSATVHYCIVQQSFYLFIFSLSLLLFLFAPSFTILFVMVWLLCQLLPYKIEYTHTAVSICYFLHVQSRKLAVWCALLGNIENRALRELNIDEIMQLSAELLISIRATHILLNYKHFSIACGYTNELNFCTSGFRLNFVCLIKTAKRM